MTGEQQTKLNNLLSEITRLAILVVITTALLSPQTTGAASITLQTPKPDCTYQIQSAVDTVDGLKEYAHVKPGDILCLEAGLRGNLRLQNLHGEKDRPIIVRNSGGIVEITGEQFLTGGIGILDSSYLRVTGSGVSDQCGAEYPVDQQFCGIEIYNTIKGIKINTEGNNVHDIEIDHISVHDVSQEIKTRGITIHPLPTQVVSGISIHHNHVYRTEAEGIYIGTEPHDQPFEQLAKIKNLDISYNLVEQTGYDGIKIKVAIENVQVHHNLVRQPGLLKTQYHEGGIKIALSVGDYYNNIIYSDREGIVMGRDLTSPGTRYFNNLVVGAQLVGIAAPENNAMVFNNTIVNSGAVGILARGSQAQVFNNIVVETSGKAFDIKTGTNCYNYTGSLDSAGFLDPVNHNFSLGINSPAIDAGKRTTPVTLVDIRGIIRPQGLGIDLGAFERPAGPSFYKNTQWTPNKTTFPSESCK